MQCAPPKGGIIPCLHELGVRGRQACSERHGVAVAGARVRGGGAEVRPPVTAGGQHLGIRTHMARGAIKRRKRHA